MEKTWRPITAGVLNIVSGAIALIWFAMLIIALATIGNIPSIPHMGVVPGPGIVAIILWSWAIPSIIIGILALIGGIYALQRKKWGLVLTGSIAATLFWFFVGIPAIIFTALSKNEFEQ